MVSASDRTLVVFSFSVGNSHDAPKGELLLDQIVKLPEQVYMLMDRAYEGDSTRAIVVEKGFVPVVPPKRTVKSRGNTTKNATNNVMK